MAKTLVAAAEAATAPGTPMQRPQASRVPAAAQVIPPSRPASAQVPGPAVRSAGGFGERSQHLKRSVWQPLAVYSGALWLRVTGTFFALLAVTMGTGAWHLHSTLRRSSNLLGAHHFWIFLFFAALFGYFAVSSFVRAGLKERRAANLR